ncbi:MAG: SemiSWEET transporter [Candidatus Aenigmatarchaeota archaeon]
MDWIFMLGIIAAIFTTISFLPQAIKSIKTRHTKDISIPTYVIMVTGLLLWLAYGILLNNLPIIIATAVFALLILALKIKWMIIHTLSRNACTECISKTR